ncbi:MAG: diacylglycerol kinase [Kofleriaceae bacterium]|nr:diacylglycerol kinase [Kofleriaceae bacterium]MCB9571883.1 diacylglycerol kinase [Kofleriaceae bacterium]
MDVAVVVNLRARRGSEDVGAMVRHRLPRARVRVTRTLDDVRRWIDDELAPAPPDLLLSGGGDGTAVTLLNELRDRQVDVAHLGVLRLGTGNGWANATGAPRAHRAISGVAALGDAAPPTRRFALVECDGRIAPFLGTGWDAEIVSDFRAQVEAMPRPLRRFNDGLPAYLMGMFTRTIPRHVRGAGPANVVVTNLGDDALTVDAHGRVVPLPGGERGAVLYRGPASVAAAATTEQWGFGFRAFPFAHAAPGRVSVRVYGAPVLEATRNMFRLWRGEHPMPRMHDFFLTHGRMEFDREVPFQIGGDVAAPRRSFEFRIARESVAMVDWRRLAA